MSKKSKTKVVHRDSGTGEFITEKEFNRRKPDTVEKERVKLPPPPKKKSK